MDEFLLQIDGNHFRQTNGPWNDLCLNDPWSVGYVTTLIETQNFETKEEWEKFYNTSGENRNLNLVDISEQIQTLLNDHTLNKTNPQQITALKWNYRNSLLSGYKSNKFNWLQFSLYENWPDLSKNPLFIGVFSNKVRLKICKIS